MISFPKSILITVLTGFLGSGKTTLLSEFVKNENVNDIAFIINEFGEVGLDHNLIESCLLYTSPSPRDISGSRMPSSA